MGFLTIIIKKRYHTRKWLPIILINLFIGAPIDQYNYNLKLKGYAENVYKVRELTFSDIHSIGISIETMTCEFAESQKLNPPIHIKRLLVSHLKPSLIPKITDYIKTTELLLRGIRIEHTPYHYKNNMQYRDLNLWDYWTYPIRILQRYSYATGAVDLDKLFNNILRNCLFNDSWLWSPIEMIDAKTASKTYYDRGEELKELKISIEYMLDLQKLSSVHI